MSIIPDPHALQRAVREITGALNDITAAVVQLGKDMRLVTEAMHKLNENYKRGEKK